jgi:DNA invertase Pin-like site-specific DNA recombinase
MRAAIYARKSTEQQGVADEAKSVARQIEHARAFAEGQGWTVGDDHVQADDGVSGAEFEDRPGLTKVVLAAKMTPRPFDVLVTMDQDRIGRDQVRPPMILNDPVQAGIGISYYGSGQELRLDSPTDRLLANVINFGNEWYRHQVRMKTREAMRARAQKGFVAGGKVLGYKNVEVSVGDKRSHIVREVDLEQAEIVRRMFRMAPTARGCSALPGGRGWTRPRATATGGASRAGSV